MRSGLLGAILVVLGVADFAQAAVNISDKPTRHMRCSAGVCSPTAKKAVLNATDLANMLQAADVTVTTGSGAIMIEIVSGLSWASANRLTLDANCNVSVKAPVTVAGPGGLTIVTNDGGSDCELLFLPGGKIDFWDLSSSLQINGRSYTLVDDIATLAAAIADDPAGSYALAKDYDASSDGIYGASPISTAFAGSFDGLGHTIANVSIVFEKTATNVGFFEALNTGAIVRDLLLQHISLAPKLHARANLASLAFYNAGSIYNVAVIGSSMRSNPRYYTCSGGLAGLNYGAIERSDVNDTTVLSGGDSGGLACVNFGTISQSRANASVGGGEGAWAGGLAAQNHGTIALSSAAGTAQVTPNRVGRDHDEGAGGLVGINYGRVDQSYSAAGASGGRDWSSDVLSNAAYAGGLIAQNYGTLSNCYSVGPASATNGIGDGVYVGGLTGLAQNPDSIESCYSVSPVEAISFHNGALGGLIGTDTDSANVSDYWDLDTSGIGDPSQGAGNIANDDGITGLSDAQLKSGLPAGFDPAIWGQSASINNGYPYLLANPPP